MPLYGTELIHLRRYSREFRLVIPGSCGTLHAVSGAWQLCLHSSARSCRYVLLFGIPT